MIRISHPTDGGTQLKKIEDIAVKGLGYEFRLKVDEIKEKIMSGRSIKMINGNPINGLMLSKMIEKFVDTLNIGKLPELSIT